MIPPLASQRASRRLESTLVIERDGGDVVVVITGTYRPGLRGTFWDAPEGETVEDICAYFPDGKPCALSSHEDERAVARLLATGGR